MIGITASVISATDLDMKNPTNALAVIIENRAIKSMLSLSHQLSLSGANPNIYSKAWLPKSCYKCYNKTIACFLVIFPISSNIWLINNLTIPGINFSI